MNCAKTTLQVSSAILENHNRLQNICNKHDKLANNMQVQDDINKSKMIEELKYYEVSRDIFSYKLYLCTLYIILMFYS